MARTNFLHLPPFAKFKSHSLSDYNPTSGQVSRFELKKVFNHSIFNQKQTNIGACEYNIDEIWRAFLYRQFWYFLILLLSKSFMFLKIPLSLEATCYRTIKTFFIRYIWTLSLFDLERLQFQNPISPQFLEEGFWEKIYGKLAQTFDVLNICDLICDED